LSLLFDSSFFAAALSHLAVDLLNAERPVLLAALSGPLGLTNAVIGLISMGYTLSGSVFQPLFGLIADRVGPRWLAAFGLAWLAAMFALAVLLPGNEALIFLVLGGIGSASFHPAGAMEATAIGRAQIERRESTAASIFFLFGQVGYTAAPAIGGPIIDRWGPAGLALLVPLAIPIAINAGLRFKPSVRAAGDDPVASNGSKPGTFPWLAVVSFGSVALLQSWATSNMTTFLPKYYSDLGYSATLYGAIAAVFMAGTAIGGVAGGWLGDRVDRRVITCSTMLLAAGPLLLFPSFGATGWSFGLSFLAGLLTGVSYSLIVVTGQSLLPGRPGVASGLSLGFTFASGSIGTLVSGILADRSGFGAVFATTAVLCVLAAVMGLWMPNPHGTPGRGTVLTTAGF
jgi:FSR family fosmidomycin resistance protein-like MFS transporter